MDDKLQDAREALLETIAKQARGQINASTVERLAHAYALVASAKPASVENVGYFTLPD